MKLAEIQRRYSELQRYVGWSRDDELRVARAARLIRPHIPALVADFYAALLAHPAAARVITGGQPQVERLRGTLALWIDQLLSGPYDAAYVEQRAKVGLKHVEIGLEQVYTNVALSRIRSCMVGVLLREDRDDFAEQQRTIAAVNRLLDLDLAVISAVYEGEYIEREKTILRTRLEGALHQEKELAESLLAHAQAIVLVVDLQGNIVRFNAYLEQLAGFSLAELQGHGWLESLIASEDRARILQEVVDRPLDRAGRRSAAAATGTMIARDGQGRTIRWSSTALRDADGVPYALLVVGHDVTDLIGAQERLLQAQRLATIGQVAAGLAHEARNALQRIQASAEMLELEVRDRPEALSFVRRIEQSQTHLNRLFDEVRGYAAPIKLDRTECRLSSLWHEAWELLAAQRAGRAAELIGPGSSGDVDLSADHFRMVQVFRNLLENSLAAAEGEVCIEIRCAPTRLRGAAAVCIRVRDNGTGIPPAHHTKVFEPFYTTKPKGTGLGMAIAKRLVEAHGGTIEVGAYTPGAEIVVILPLDEPA